MLNDSDSEKLLSVLKSADAHFGSKVIQKLDPMLIGDEIAQNAASAVPSIQLTGMCCKNI